MRARWRSRTAVIAFSVAAILNWSGAAWGDISVAVPEPTAAPGPGNDFNVMAVSPDGPPLRAGDTVTFTSSSDIANVEVTGGSAGSPYRVGNGNTNVDIKLTAPHPITVVVTYRSGKKRGVVLATGMKTLTITRIQTVTDIRSDFYGALEVRLQGTHADSAETMTRTAFFRNLLPEAARPAAPVREVGSNTEGQKGAGSTTGSTGGTTATTH